MVYFINLLLGTVYCNQTHLISRFKLMKSSQLYTYIMFYC